MPPNKLESKDFNKFFTPLFTNFNFNAKWLVTRTLNYCTTSAVIFFHVMVGCREKLFHFTSFMACKITWNFSLTWENTIKSLTKKWQKYNFIFHRHRILFALLSSFWIFFVTLALCSQIQFSIWMRFRLLLHFDLFPHFLIKKNPRRVLKMIFIFLLKNHRGNVWEKNYFNYPHYDDIQLEVYEGRE